MLHIEVDKLKDLVEEERRLLHVDFKNLKNQEDELDQRLRTEIDIRLQRIQKLKRDLQDLQNRRLPAEPKRTVVRKSDAAEKLRQLARMQGNLYRVSTGHLQVGEEDLLHYATNVQHNERDIDLFAE